MSKHENLVTIGCDSTEPIEQRLHQRMARIRRRLVVVSGKGGVGKSTAAANLAVALASRGLSVGLLDVDIHGPSIPKILGCGRRLRPIRWPVNDARRGAAQSHSHVSGVFHWQQSGCRDLARANEVQGDPTVSRDVAWGDLDYLVVDCPPGTGDEPLSIAQLVGRPAAAVVVTTPRKWPWQTLGGASVSAGRRAYPSRAFSKT